MFGLLDLNDRVSNACFVFRTRLLNFKQRAFSEEITGVFVKSLVPNSSAHLSKRIQVHDLILEVNGRSLEKRRHAEAVKSLVKSGSKVKLKIIRFHPESPQAVCLKMLHEQVQFEFV